MALCSLLKFRVSFLRIPGSLLIHLQSAAMKGKNSIPDRWVEYVPVGKRIPGTRFIAFKVPLKRMYDAKLAPWQRFSTSDLIHEVENQNEELGLVVDLTCTERYYSPKEFPNTIAYSKIFTIGHEVPSDAVIAQFKRIVEQYLHENSKNDKLVGVHCTHGLNRTGYLVCRYLIDMLSMEPSEAIEKFNSSRGHSIERKNYLDDLLHGKSRSNVTLDKPQANNQQHFKKQPVNSHPAPYPEEQPWSHSHTSGAPMWGPRFSGPLLARPPFHHQPGHMMRPQHGFPHSGGRHPSPGPRILRPGFPPSDMPGSRHSLLPKDGNPPHHFRAPNRHGHRLQRPHPPHRVNGTPPQDYNPCFSQPRDGNPGNGFPARPSHSHHGNTPYQRYPKPGRKMNPKKH